MAELGPSAARHGLPGQRGDRHGGGQRAVARRREVQPVARVRGGGQPLGVGGVGDGGGEVDHPRRVLPALRPHPGVHRVPRGDRLRRAVGARRRRRDRREEHPLARGPRRVGEPHQPGLDRGGVAACGDVVGADVEDDVGRAERRRDVARETGLRAAAHRRRRPAARCAEIPALSTAIVAPPPAAVSRAARASVQRAFASGTVPTPSVIESPTATTACTGRGASTSTPLSSSHDVVGAPSSGATPRGASQEVCSATGCSLTTSGSAGRATVTASGPEAATGTGSLTASPPGGITVAARPPNVTGRSVPDTTAALMPADAPADTASTASGADPYTLESRTRTCAPSTCGRTTIRSVPPPATARGAGPGCIAACHAVTQLGPHAAAAAARGRPAVPRHPTRRQTRQPRQPRRRPRPAPAEDAREPASTGRRGGAAASQ